MTEPPAPDAAATVARLRNLAAVLPSMKLSAKPTIAAKAQAAALRQRLQGLEQPQAEMLRRVIKLSSEGERLLSGQLLLALAQQAPDHPEVLRWCGIRHAGAGEWAPAADCLQRAASQRPGDVEIWSLLGRVQDLAGDTASAPQSLRAAARHASDLQSWLTLSLEFDRQGYYDDSLQAVEHALRLDPASAVLLLQRSRCLKALGHAQRAAADCRALIASGREVARAWFSLLDLKTEPLAGAELAQLQQAAAAVGVPAADRMLLDFALGKALEDAGQPAAAFAALQRANGAARLTHPWDATAFAAHVAAVRAVFERVVAGGARAQAQGSEVIFLVGLPRSGTTLVEQVLASHSRVEGASELPYLSQVVDAESRRRGRPFPDWAADTSQADWTRLGRHYLQLSARWRASKPVATDKLPENWLLAGAALAMLPDARVIDCRRDPVETCWSCYKQLFGPGRVGFTYAFDDLAAYWHAYDGLCRFWADAWPARFTAQGYEALVAEPERQIRALLDFCGLPFEAQCLQSHTAQRAIRTPSALQVRKPMTATSTPAAQYAGLLDPLRQLLAQR